MNAEVAAPIEASRAARPLRLVFVAEHLTAGGTETYVLTKARWLRRRGHEVTIASSGGELEAQADEAGIARATFPTLSQRVVADATAVRADEERFVELVRRARPDAIYVSPIRPFRFGQTAARELGVPLVLQVFSSIHVPPLAERDAVAALAARGRLFHVHPAQARLFAEQFAIPIEQIRVVPNPVDLARFQPLDGARVRQELGIAPDDFVVLSNSRLDHDKAVYVGLLIRAFPRIAQMNPRALLVIVGDGDRRAALEDAARRLGIGRIRFLGRRLDIPEVLSVADVFVGMAYAAQEAAACGKPVVYSPLNLRAQPETCAEGYLGVAEPGRYGWPLLGDRPRSFEALIAALMLDPTFRARVAASGHEVVRERYAAERLLPEWEAFYFSLAN